MAKFNVVFCRILFLRLLAITFPSQKKEEKAKKDAEQRIKKYAKLQQKQLKKMEDFYKGYILT